MENLTQGSQVEMKDGSIVTIKEIKAEITFEKSVNGATQIQTLSLPEFEELVKSDHLEIEPGLKFLDIDNTSSEILEVSSRMLLYKKQYGADIWNNSVTIKEFQDKVRSGQIKIQQ